MSVDPTPVIECSLQDVFFLLRRQGIH